ncbi:MAG TPA: DUF2267 domain-containing protein [Candidatus Saccharimonadales bacterium]|jgi:uncharacterized protein (DUF2267 family)
MKYRELIKKVQLYSGFSDTESQDALDSLVESLAIHLNEGERKDFASQLPQELQDRALAVLPTKETSRQDMLEQIMEVERIPEPRAKKQMLAAWRALKDAISEGEIDDIRAQLPRKTVALLH